MDMQRTLGVTFGLGFVLFLFLGAACLLPRLNGVQCVLVETDGSRVVALQPGIKPLSLSKMFYFSPPHLANEPSHSGQAVAFVTFDEQSDSLILSIAKPDGTEVRRVAAIPLDPGSSDIQFYPRISWSADDQYLDLSGIGNQQAFVSIQESKIVETFVQSTRVQWMPRGHRISLFDPLQAKLMVKVPGTQAADHIVDLVFPSVFSDLNPSMKPAPIIAWSDDEQYVALEYQMDHKGTSWYESDIYSLAGGRWLGIQSGIMRDEMGETYSTFWGWVKDELIYQDNPVLRYGNPDSQPTNLIAFDAKTRTFKTLDNNLAADLRDSAVMLDDGSQRLAVLEWQDDNRIRIQLMDYDGSNKFTVLNDANAIDLWTVFLQPYFTATVMDTSAQPRSSTIFRRAWSPADLDISINQMRLVWVNFDGTNLHSLAHHMIRLLYVSDELLCYLAEDNGLTHMYEADAKTGKTSILLRDVPQDIWNIYGWQWQFLPSPDKKYLVVGYAPDRISGEYSIYLRSSLGETKPLFTSTDTVRLQGWSPDSAFFSLESEHVPTSSQVSASLMVFRAADAGSAVSASTYSQTQWTFCPTGSKS